jgi:hypothetical protein
MSLQWIELQRDPLGVSDRNGKPHIRAGGNKLKVTSALQSLDDKIRIATKVCLQLLGHVLNCNKYQ